jgi:hypothetical protein
MTLPHFVYAEPQLRTSSLDAVAPKLKAATKRTLDTPGIDLVLALDYYRVEAFATARDRDAACGLTAHRDVRYVPAERRTLNRGGLALDDIACGYTVDHPRFEEIAVPLVDNALKRLVEALMNAAENHTGVIASATVSIARVEYTISAERTGDWIKFPIGARALFETTNSGIIDKTIDWLHHHVMLKASPSLVDARPN